VAANQIAAAPLDSLTGLVFILIGWPVYRIWARRAFISNPLVADGD
jgi:hypothetical protein